MLIYLYVFDLDICDIHLLRNCDRSELHHIIIIYQNNHVLELCLGSNYIYVCWRKRRTNCRDMPTKLAKKPLSKRSSTGGSSEQLTQNFTHLLRSGARYHVYGSRGVVVVSVHLRGLMPGCLFIITVIRSLRKTIKKY
ncbi:hypothetical protein WN943_011675 [Citrus x changshan-huyou]